MQQQLQAVVAAGGLHFVLLGGGGGGRGGTSAVTAWVQAHGTLVDPAVYGGSTAGSGGQQLYDLAGAA